MEDRDKSEIVEVLTPLMAMYPNWKPESETLKLYAMVLADVNEELLKEAILVLLTEGREFMPVAGAIREAALDLLRYRDEDPNVYTAWSQVMGYFNGRKRVHPHVTEVVKLMGGWNVIGRSNNLTSERARFIDAFRELAAERKQKARMLPRTRRFIGEEEIGKLQIGDERPKTIGMFADDPPANDRPPVIGAFADDLN